MAAARASKITIADVIRNARRDCVDRMAEGKPVTASYFIDCDCGDPGCEIKWVVTVTPATEITYHLDGRRSFQ